MAVCCSQHGLCRKLHGVGPTKIMAFLNAVKT